MLSFARLRRVLAEWWRPIITAIFLCTMVFVTRPSSVIDRRLSDALLTRQQLAADTRVLLVVIDAGDVRKYGGPPLKRAALAKVLTKLEQGKAQRVLVDANLSERLDDKEDYQFAKALHALGPARVALTTVTGSNDKPYAYFAEQASIVDSRLTADQDGWHRQIGENLNHRGPNPATWLATGKADLAPVQLDLRIAPRGFQRVSVRQLLDSEVNIAGRLVIVSTSSSIAPSRAYLPLTGYADRAAVLAIGAQSVSQGHPAAVQRGWLINALLQVLAVILSFAWTAAAKSGRKLGFGLGAIGIWTLVASLTVARHYAIAIAPVALLTCIAAIVNVTLAFRFKIFQLLASFLKGDISPEEAWAWRGSVNTAHPAMLFGADGRVKRSNEAAKDLVERHGEQMAALCIPHIGERADRVVVPMADGADQIFRLNWPYPHVQIAVLQDNSETEALQLSLQNQLNTDPLTDIGNRRGFDAALSAAAMAGTGYAVFFIDMNGFKAINDTHGHDTGDEVLIIAAQRIRSLLQPGDFVARLGGDEFAIIVRRAIDESSAQLLARSLELAFFQPVKLKSRDLLLQVGAAVGFAISDDNRSDSASVLRRADQAMYACKREQKARLAA